MNLTNYLANALRDVVCRNTAYTTPTTVYLAAFTTAATAAGGGTEATGGSYARQAVAFAAASVGHADNSAAVSFTGMPAGTFVHMALYDALTAGNMLLFGPITTASITLLVGETLGPFAIGDIDVVFS